MRKGTNTWPLLIDNFLLTFAFESEYPNVDQALDVINIKIFEDPWNINIPESEGTRDVDGPNLQTPEITEPLKIKKINIGIDTEPKFASIGDYWTDETVG